MNIERINALADLIEQADHTDTQSPDGFGMKNLTHDCGTPMCIAGYAAWLAQGCPDNLRDGEDKYGIENEAAWYLGLPGGVEYDDFPLFYPRGVNMSWDDITPQHAARVLRHLAATGKVDWSIK